MAGDEPPLPSRDRAFTVGEAIDQLMRYPRNLRLLVEGAQAGYHDAMPPVEVRVVINKNQPENWRHGPHDTHDALDWIKGEAAILISRYQPGD